MAYIIIIKQGNLLNEESDFIVNPSNTKLLLGSGVSMAFKRHCGIELQKEMDAALEAAGGLLKQGDVVVTSSAGAKNFKYALHVAVMNYNPGVRYKEKNPTLETIETALHNIENHLSEYAKKEQRKIKVALPLMGCGVGGLDKEDVIKLYKRFFERDVAFACEVVIYGYSKEDYKLLSYLINK